jgi:soluble epoxide hydrolase/lipid-phosphate phosphatase
VQERPLNPTCICDPHSVKMKLLDLALSFLFLFSAATASNITVPGATNGTTSHYITVRNVTYHYLHAYPSPSTTPKGTILLFHGLPDFSYGWHHTIPFLSSIGYRILAPDNLGTARTSAPCPISRYTFKEMTADIAAIVDAVIGPDEQVIVGGHDWGTGLAYKFPMWYPDKTRAMFALSFPYTQTYFGPNVKWVDLEALVESGAYATYGYQLQWRDVSFDRNFTSKEDIRTLLTALVGGSTADGRYAVLAETGILYDVLPDIAPESGFLKGEELDIYVDAISRHGVRGGWNWYRTRRMNFEDEVEIARKGEFRYELPALFIPSLKDTTVLPKYYEEEMRASFDDLTIEPLNASHWLLLEDPQGVNEIVGKWLGELE